MARCVCRWVSVSERLPTEQEQGNLYLVFVDDGGPVETSARWEGEGEWSTDEPCRDFEETPVTHWLDGVPKLPETKEE